MKASYKKSPEGHSVIIDGKHKANVKRISPKLWGLYDLSGRELSTGKTRDKAIDNANLLQNQSLNLDPEQAEMLLDAIKKVSPVLSHNNYGLPELKNILIFQEGDQVNVVATDGHRMHCVVIETKINHLGTMLLNPRNKFRIQQCILTGNNDKRDYGFIKKSIKNTITACSRGDDILMKKNNISTTYTQRNKEKALIELKDGVYRKKFVKDAIDQIKGDSIFFSSFNDIGAIKGHNFMAFIAAIK